ncbi:MAG TPA: nucleotidyltransferase family protein [Synergistales bacterium]|nr:nucleotidyltransferase family protein [Synergistales bacterium]
MNALQPVEDKRSIIERLRRERTALASLGVLEIGLFGSFARGEQTPESDVDLLVEFTPQQHTFDSFMDLSFFLEALLGRKVELLTRESLSPYIGERILAEVEKIHGAA